MHLKSLKTMSARRKRLWTRAICRLVNSPSSFLSWWEHTTAPLGEERRWKLAAPNFRQKKKSGDFSFPLSKKKVLRCQVESTSGGNFLVQPFKIRGACFPLASTRGRCLTPGDTLLKLYTWKSIFNFKNSNTVQHNSIIFELKGHIFKGIVIIINLNPQ